MSLRRENELLSDEDGLDTQQKLCLGSTVIGAILGLCFGGLPGVFIGGGGGYVLAVALIGLLTKISDFNSKR